jgi:hypothetical protein
MKDLTIRKLIEELQKYPNQDAHLNIVTNMVDVDDDAFDVSDCELSCFQQDVEDAECYDLFVCRAEDERNKMQERNDERITELLEKHERLTIQLDMFDNHSNIVITNDENEVLRDIKVGGRHYQHTNIGIMLISII